MKTIDLIWGAVFALVFGACLFAVLMLTGCPASPQSNARDTIAAFSGYLTAAQSKHTMECVRNQGMLPVCFTLRQADAAENAAIDALEAYCQIPPHTAFTGNGKSCKPASSFESGLNSALASLNEITPDIKAAAQ